MKLLSFAIAVSISGMSFAAFAAEPAAAPESPAKMEKPEKMVFAHFMVCLPCNGDASLEAYERQVRLARQYGIDGFALNCGSWTKDPYYIERSAFLYEAAKRVSPDFKLFFSIDTATKVDPVSTAMDMMKRFYGHPNQFRYGGKAFLSAYSSPKYMASWTKAMEEMKSAGYDVCFVPFLWTDNCTLTPSYDGVLNTLADAPCIDGYFLFGIDAPAWDIIQGNANSRRATDKAGKLYMATNSFAYNSANLRDFHGMRDYAMIWDGIVKDNADMVELVTWNDYTEDSHLSPAYAGPGPHLQMDRINHDESYLDVTSYCSAWYKSGRQPEISQEKLYYVYRERSKWLDAAFDQKKQLWTKLADQIHDDVEDNIYACSFLKEPADLTIQIGDKSQSFRLNAGISHVEMPFQPGVPRFALKRNGVAVAEFLGRQEIIKEATKENSSLVWRNSNRTWTGVWCLGAGKKLSACSSTLLGDAKAVDAGGAKAASISSNNGSGILFPDDKAFSGPLNFRVRYMNPGASICRLTMASGKTPSCVFPVLLPPTGDKWENVSFLWTPPMPGAALSIEHKEGDLGEALIESVEIVQSQPASMPSIRNADSSPEMVALPGGSFMMGSLKGDPDEAPVHKVELSPFLMGKFEVTNAEFERFMPERRKYRDEYSWRDGDPVIYVSWQRAAQYCNWLSRQEGLTPAYDESTWTVNLRAGYRLPTEAEWEYAASGRGEGRVYPWGDAVPDKMLCNFDGTCAVSVGSHPSGASRDGIMDMAGNLAEWCTDFYHPYVEAPAKDPCNLEPGPYRAIRGGSWGYYNKSQRCSDREFNTQVYPGYYYIGFRLVLPKGSENSK